MSTNRPVSDPLIRAIEEGPKSQAELARETGLAESVVSRFRRGIADPTAPAIDALAKALGMELRPVKPSTGNLRSRNTAKPSNKPTTGRAGTSKGGR